MSNGHRGVTAIDAFTPLGFDFPRTAKNAIAALVLTVIRHGAALLIIVKTWRLASNDRLLRAMPVTALGRFRPNASRQDATRRRVRARAPLLGGLDAWAVAGYPVEPNDPL